MVSRRKSGIIIVGLFLLISPLSRISGSPQDTSIPDIVYAWVGGTPMTTGRYDPVLITDSIELQFQIDPVVDRVNNRGYVGTFDVILWWKHEDMTSYISVVQTFSTIEQSTSLFSTDHYIIGPMDETTYPNNLGAGQIYWYVELEAEMNRRNYFDPYLPQSPALNIEFITGVEEPTPTIPAPEEPVDPFEGIIQDIFEPLGLEEEAKGFLRGLGSITGNPVLMFMVIAIGGLLAFVIIRGRAEQRGAPAPKRPRKRRKKKQEPALSVAGIRRRLGFGKK